MESNHKDIKEELRKLIDLQAVDCLIFDTRSMLEEFPAKISRMQESLELKKKEMQEAESELKKLQVLKNEKETDISSKEAKIKKYQSDLYGIKNNKEFQSLQQEIGSIKADISVTEDSLLELFDSIESAKARLEEEKKKFDAEASVSDKEKETIRSQEKDLAAELSGHVSRRDKLAAQIDPDVLVQYRKILDKWGRTAVATVKGEFCGECNMHLRPQIINESRLGKNLVFCESCSRILYAEN